MHRAVGSGTARSPRRSSQHLVDGARERAPFRPRRLGRAAACRGQAVDAAAPALARAPGALDEPASLQPVQRGVERSLRNTQLAAAALSEPLAELVAVTRRAGQDGEQQPVQMPAQQVRSHAADDTSTAFASTTLIRRFHIAPTAGSYAAPMASDDADLLHALRAGDERAFGEIVREWSPLLLRVAGSFVTTHASAEECVQEAWLAVIRGLDGFEGRSRLRTWVVGIVVNIARRRAQRDGRMLSPTPAQDSGPTVDPRRSGGPGEQWAGGWTEQGAPREWEPEAVLLAGEAMELLLRGLEELPPRQRAVVTLHDVHGLTADEVCTVLALSAGNQRVLLHRGRARLRQLLEDYYRPPVEMATS